jgi:hypothetical protein
LAPGTSAKASGPALFRRGQSNTHALSGRDSCSGGTAARGWRLCLEDQEGPNQAREEAKGGQPKARNQDLHQLDRPVGPNHFGGILCVRKNVAVHQRTLIRVESSDVYEALAARWCAAHRAVRARIAAGHEAGELADDADVKALASLVTTTLYGLAIKARDGTLRARLRGTVEQLMRMWPRHGAA